MNSSFGETRNEVESSANASQPSRREWFKRSAGGCAGLALSSLIDLPVVGASTQNLKLSEVSEFTASCNFCSCGCGMIASVREGKLIATEGDFDHVVNRGSLCVKGISMFATHSSANRLRTPRYRAPGSDHWEEISWENAVERVAQKIRKTRDATWISTEKLSDAEVPVNRTDAIASFTVLQLLLGNVGKPGSGVNALRGEPNVQGACDMGVLSNYLRIDYCGSCGGYLKTYNGSGSESVLLADWTSLHLDVIARDQGRMSVPQYREWL